VHVFRQFAIEIEYWRQSRIVTIIGLQPCLHRSIRPNLVLIWPWLVGCSSPLHRPWAHRWINHWSLWRMASTTPDLRLPSQAQDIADLQLVPNYTVWRQRHIVCKQLAQGRYLAVERPGVELATYWVASRHPNYYITKIWQHKNSNWIKYNKRCTQFKKPKIYTIHRQYNNMGIGESEHHVN